MVDYEISRTKAAARRAMVVLLAVVLATHCAGAVRGRDPRIGASYAAWVAA